MNNLKGNFYKVIGKVLDFLITLFIVIVNLIVDVFSTLRHAIGLALSMGGCLILLIILNPFFLYRHSYILAVMILAVIVPFLGKISVSYLKYAHYIITEFFYDRSDYYLYGNKKYKEFSEYSRKYFEDQEKERIRREEERRKAEEKAWNERFKNFGGFTWTTFDGFEDFEDFFGGNFDGSYNENYDRNYQGSNKGYGSYNVGMGFKQKYEDSCSILGVSPTADKYEIKLAYRKKAKEYHPDINKSPGATEMFQKINAAYEFLNDSNIERYKNLTKN